MDIAQIGCTRIDEDSFERRDVDMNITAKYHQVVSNTVPALTFAGECGVGSLLTSDNDTAVKSILGKASLQSGMKTPTK